MMRRCNTRCWLAAVFSRAVKERLGLIDHAAEAAAADAEAEKREESKRKQRRKRAKRAVQLDAILNALAPAAAGV